MEYSWESFGHFGETLGLHFGTLALHLGALGVHVGVFGHFGVWPWIPRATFYGKGLGKGTQNGRLN